MPYTTSESIQIGDLVDELAEQYFGNFSGSDEGWERVVLKMAEIVNAKRERELTLHVAGNIIIGDEDGLHMKVGDDGIAYWSGIDKIWP